MCVGGGLWATGGVCPECNDTATCESPIQVICNGNQWDETPAIPLRESVHLEKRNINASRLRQNELPLCWLSCSWRAWLVPGWLSLYLRQPSRCHCVSAHNQPELSPVWTWPDAERILVCVQLQRLTRTWSSAKYRSGDERWGFGCNAWLARIWFSLTTEGPAQTTSPERHYAPSQTFPSAGSSLGNLIRNSLWFHQWEVGHRGERACRSL